MRHFLKGRKREKIKEINSLLVCIVIENRYIFMTMQNNCGFIVENVQQQMRPFNPIEAKFLNYK